MRSRLPKRFNTGDAAIFNNKDPPGEHWIAIAKSPTSKKVYVYDSFGRPNSEFNLPKSYKQTNNNPEQALLQQDCGARSLAWLATAMRFGVDRTASII